MNKFVSSIWEIVKVVIIIKIIGTILALISLFILNHWSKMIQFPHPIVFALVVLGVIFVLRAVNSKIDWLKLNEIHKRNSKTKHDFWNRADTDSSNTERRYKYVVVVWLRRNLQLEVQLPEERSLDRPIRRSTTAAGRLRRWWRNIWTDQNIPTRQLNTNTNQKMTTLEEIIERLRKAAEYLRAEDKITADYYAGFTIALDNIEEANSKQSEAWSNQ